MARLIDAGRLHDCIMDNDIHSGIMSLKNVYEFIDEQPTVDAVPVVRCRDCEHWDDEWCVINEAYFEDDDFCSYGKRKENRG